MLVVKSRVQKYICVIDYHWNIREKEQYIDIKKKKEKKTNDEEIKKKEKRKMRKTMKGW